MRHLKLKHKPDKRVSKLMEGKHTGKSPYKLVKKKRKPHEYRWQPTDEDLLKIERLAGQGLNMEQIAYSIGVGPATFNRRRDEAKKALAEAKTKGEDVEDYGEIDKAIKRGRSKAIALVTNSLFNRAINGDLGSQVFYLKNQAGWRDRVTQEVTGADGGPIQYQDTTEHSDEERAARLAQILNAARERRTRQTPGGKKSN